MVKNNILEIESLSVKVDERQILRELSLKLDKGKVMALMGPNGSGKSSLAHALIGDNKYEVGDNSKIIFEGEEIQKLSVDERARRGIYMAWQNPLTIPGVKVFTLCKTAYETTGKLIESVTEFKEKLESILEEVGLPKDYLGRSVNDGFSGGEKKRLEMAQMMLLEPKLVILDEIDSGMDVDALKMVGEVVKKMVSKGTAFVLITHYKRLLEYAPPDIVNVLKDGKIVNTGGKEIIEEIDSHGYKQI